MPTTDKRPLKVFLCHAHADRDPVRALYTRLTNDGVDAWLDKEKLLPGQDWELEIKKAVREADVVVVCLSKQFNQAGFRQKEVRLALDTAMEKPEGEIFIIPARLEECDNLESLRKWHWVDLFEDDGYDMLMRALRVRAHKIGATLQIKRSWLPKINMQSEIAASTPKLVEKPQEKKLLTLQPKRNFHLPKNFNRNLIGLVGFIMLVLASIFGLPSLIGKPDEVVPTVSITSTSVVPTMSITSTSVVPTVSIIPPVITGRFNTSNFNVRSSPMRDNNVVGYSVRDAVVYVVAQFNDGEQTWYLLDHSLSEESFIFPQSISPDVETWVMALGIELYEPNEINLIPYYNYQE